MREEEGGEGSAGFVEHVSGEDSAQIVMVVRVVIGRPACSVGRQIVLPVMQRSRRGFRGGEFLWLCEYIQDKWGASCIIALCKPECQSKLRILSPVNDLVTWVVWKCYKITSVVRTTQRQESRHYAQVQYFRTCKECA